MRKHLFISIFLIALSCAGVSHAQQIMMAGSPDCGDWVTSRKNNSAAQYESYLVGILDGFSMGRNLTFWNYKSSQVTFEQVNLWMDNYCSKNPLSQVFLGADELMNEHTEGTYRKKKKL